MITKFLHRALSVNQNGEPDHLKPIENNPLLLPGDLSGRILDLQNECEGVNLSKELITELMKLYTVTMGLSKKAIQYYEAMGCPKYKIYQKRMHNFIAKSSIEQILNGKRTELVLRKQLAEKAILHAKNSSKQQIQRIFEQVNKKKQYNEQFIRQELSSQDQIIEQRIRKRRTMSNRSTKTAQIEDFNKDIDGDELFIKEVMSARLILLGIQQRNVKRVFF